MYRYIYGAKTSMWKHTHTNKNKNKKKHLVERRCDVHHSCDVYLFEYICTLCDICM